MESSPIDLVGAFIAEQMIHEEIRMFLLWPHYLTVIVPKVFPFGHIHFISFDAKIFYWVFKNTFWNIKHV